MELFTLMQSDAEALHELARRPEVARFGEHLAEDPVRKWTAWIGAPAPQERLVIGAREAGRLRATARVSLARHRRRAHIADLSLLASEGADADPALDALLSAVIDACERWLGVARITLSCPLGHPRVDGLFARHGFALEARRARALATEGVETDELGLARIRPGFVAPPALPAPPIARRASEAAPGAVTFRPLEPSDGAAMAATMSEDAVLRGTMQNPWQPSAFWVERLRQNDPAVFVGVAAELGGAFAGAGVLILSQVVRRRHCASLGMHVATAHQGHGIGRALLRELVAISDRMGVRRLELSVYEQNLRAIRLYRAAGFVEEGRERWAGWVDGTLADDLVMARVR